MRSLIISSLCALLFACGGNGHCSLDGRVDLVFPSAMTLDETMRVNVAVFEDSTCEDTSHGHFVAALDSDDFPRDTFDAGMLRGFYECGDLVAFAETAPAGGERYPELAGCSAFEGNVATIMLHVK